MKEIKYASIAIVIGAILYICYTTYSRLEEKYCWQCSREVLFERGTELISTDDDKGIEKGVGFLESAARQGHIEAQILLGELYMESLPDDYRLQNKEMIAAVRKTVGGDETKGISYFNALTETLASVEGDYVQMQYNLGVLYKNGVLQSADNTEAARTWFLRSAEGGDIHAMYEVGMYCNETGDYETARKWFTDAFDRGRECGSAIMLGDYYFYGKGLITNYDESIRWYVTALSAVSELGPDYPDKVKKRWSQNAGHRLKIAQTKAKESPHREVVTLTYGLKGGVRSYLVYTPNVNGQMVGNVQNENGRIEAKIKGGDLSSPLTNNAASMNEGLYWVLDGYAKNKYGPDKDFRFVLKK